MSDDLLKEYLKWEREDLENDGKLKHGTNIDDLSTGKVVCELGDLNGECEMSDLKPCPFCGIEPMTFKKTGLIICSYAMCGVNPESKSKEDWNKRNHDRLEQENEELREALHSLIESFECECMEVHGHYFTAYLLDNDKLEAAEKLLNK
tara:strand:- start:2848 stop:3294 length:447 start_codon:yes stop_codon:yes gene_type:complete